MCITPAFHPHSCTSALICGLESDAAGSSASPPSAAASAAPSPAAAPSFWRRLSSARLLLTHTMQSQVGACVLRGLPPPPAISPSISAVSSCRAFGKMREGGGQQAGPQHMQPQQPQQPQNQCIFCPSQQQQQVQQLLSCSKQGLHLLKRQPTAPELAVRGQQPLLCLVCSVHRQPESLSIWNRPDTAVAAAGAQQPSRSVVW